MKFRLTIELGNDVMQTGTDVARVLEKVANFLTSYEALQPDLSNNLRDLNGNKVGEWKVTR